MTTRNFINDGSGAGGGGGGDGRENAISGDDDNRYGVRGGGGGGEGKENAISDGSGAVRGGL